MHNQQGKTASQANHKALGLQGAAKSYYVLLKISCYLIGEQQPTAEIMFLLSKYNAKS
jgi:hypothetical protein